MRVLQVFMMALAVVLPQMVNAIDVVPTSMTVQGKLTDSSGNPLPAGVKTFTFRIFDWPTAGNKVWPEVGNEVQPITSDAEGLWTAQIGAFVPLREPVFATWERWLEIDVDGTTLPRVKLFTSPYAFRVATVDGAAGGVITSKVSIGTGHTNSGTAAFVAGTDNQVVGNYSTVSGGALNSALGESSVISGGQQNTTTGFASGIGGGASNLTSNSHSTVGGGYNNTASGIRSVVAGGVLNLASSDGSTVGGGGYNRARGRYSSIGGGGGTNESDSNLALGANATVGGGRSNLATGDSSVIAGGSSNHATGLYASICGGVQNSAGGGGATICGGGGNSAGGGSAAVGGGAGNNAGNDYSVVAGGRFNTASGYTSTVGGGDVNTAGSHYATVPGGFENVASGSFSFAAGARAHALHLGAFVWAGGSIQTSAFSSTGDFQFLINAAGGVGIGTNAPQQPLSVVGGMNIDQNNANAGTVVNGLRFGSLSGEAIASKRDAGGNQFGLDFYTASVNRMSITNSTGYVGIGTTAPSDPLSVVGTIRSSGCVIGSNIACPSDERFKSEIETLPNALETVEKLRGVRYAWRTAEFADRDFPKGEQIGLIAQEVQKVVPQAVVPMTDGYLAVDYARLVPLLIEGMKEQQKQIDDLRAELARQKR